MHGQCQRRLHFLITYKSKWRVIPGTFLNVCTHHFMRFFLAKMKIYCTHYTAVRSEGDEKSEVLMSPRGLLHYHRPRTRFINILSILLWYGQRQLEPYWQPVAGGKWWWPLKTQNYVTPISVHYPVNVKLVTQITKEVKARNVSGVSPFLVNFLRHTWVQIFLPPDRIKRRNSKRKWTWMKITVFMTETPQLLVERLVRIFITFGDNDACFYHFLSEWGSDIKKLFIAFSYSPEKTLHSFYGYPSSSVEFYIGYHWVQCISVLVVYGARYLVLRDLALKTPSV